MMRTIRGCLACLLLLLVPVHGRSATPPATPSAAFKDCRDCPSMRVAPAGAFTMGSPVTEEGRRLNSGGENREPGAENRELQHEVTLARPFALGVYPVTRGEYARFVSATRYQPANECFSSDNTGPGGYSSSKFNWENPGFYVQRDDEPVQCVSVLDALAYVEWLSRVTGKSYRLPTEAEWEYAARAGTATSRYWGDDPAQGCAYANGIGSEASAIFDGATTGCNDGYVFTSPVGALKPNAFGLYDMLGNTWQWVSDCWHDTYQGAPADGSSWGQEPHCRRSVLRGGSFISNHTSMRAAARHEAWPSARFFNYGFRVARSL